MLPLVEARLAVGRMMTDPSGVPAGNPETLTACLRSRCWESGRSTASKHVVFMNPLIVLKFNVGSTSIDNVADDTVCSWQSSRFNRICVTKLAVDGCSELWPPSILRTRIRNVVDFKANIDNSTGESSSRERSAVAMVVRRPPASGCASILIGPSMCGGIALANDVLALDTELAPEDATLAAR